MFALLLTYQYINTRSWQMNAARRAIRLSSNTSLLADDTSGDIAGGDDGGVVVATHNPDQGFDLTLPNGTVIWALTLDGTEVCTDGISYRFYAGKHYAYVQEFDVGGFFLLMILSILFLVALTGIWPVILGMDIKIDDINAKLEHKEKKSTVFGHIWSGLWHKKEPEQSEPDAWDKTCALFNRFKYVWLIVGAVATYIFAALAAHALCASANLPTTVKEVRLGKCWPLDTSRLGRLTASGGAPLRYNASTTRRLRQLLNGDETAAAPEVVVKADDTVDFFMNCEASLYQAKTGQRWYIQPRHVTTCKPVAGYWIEELSAFTQTHCTMGSWKPDGGGTEPGHTGNIPYMAEHPIGSCGFLKAGNLVWRGWGSYKIDTSRQWAICNKDEQAVKIVRYDTNGDELEVEHIAEELTVDPVAIGRPYGWYTSGDMEVVITTDFNDGEGTNLVFGNSNDAASVVRQHFIEGGQRLEVRAPRKIGVQPNQLQCRQMLRIANGSRFEEFRTPCTSARATVADDGISGTVIRTSSAQLCTLSVAFGNEAASTVITISATSPVSLKGVTAWRCVTQGSEGTSCGPTQPLNDIDPDVLAAQLNTTVTELGESRASDGHNIGDVAKGLSGLFGVGALQDTAVAIFTGLIVKVGVGLLFFGVVWVFNRYRNSLPCGFLRKEDPRRAVVP
jgi:hypothetical protein